MTNNNPIQNKKAFFDYEILEKFEAGIVLSGPEVKSVREGRVNLKGGYVAILSDGPYLFEVNISEYKYNSDKSLYIPNSKRKLLLNKKEIIALDKAEKTSGLTIVPLRLYFNRGLIKCEIAIAKGKKNYDKRAALKTKSQTLDVRRALRNF
jgi:SsrA-binding protein